MPPTAIFRYAVVGLVLTYAGLSYLNTQAMQQQQRTEAFCNDTPTPTPLIIADHRIANDEVRSLQQREYDRHILSGYVADDDTRAFEGQYRKSDIAQPPFLWSVKHHRPTRCRAGPCTSAPHALNAGFTRLSEAANTSVGSIMPAFHFKEE